MRTCMWEGWKEREEKIGESISFPLVSQCYLRHFPKFRCTGSSIPNCTAIKKKLFSRQSL